jgi:hypothetical protein
MAVLRALGRQVQVSVGGARVDVPRELLDRLGGRPPECQPRAEGVPQDVWSLLRQPGRLLGFVQPAVDHPLARGRAVVAEDDPRAGVRCVVASSESATRSREVITTWRVRLPFGVPTCPLHSFSSTWITPRRRSQCLSFNATISPPRSPASPPSSTTSRQRRSTPSPLPRAGRRARPRSSRSAAPSA